MRCLPQLSRTSRGRRLAARVRQVTKSLLGYGVIAGAFYVVASLAEALARSGFSLAHDDWSLLANGALGWIHVLVLVLTGLMVAASAVGVVRQLRTEGLNAASGWFLGVYGTGLVGAGFFVGRPGKDGFSIGTPPGPRGQPELACDAASSSSAASASSA